MADKIFVKGMGFRKPQENAPDFVKGKISVEVDKFIPFAKEYQNNGWINIDLKKSKGGTLYLELNTYRKGAKQEPSTEEPSQEEIDATLAKEAELAAQRDEALGKIPF